MKNVLVPVDGSLPSRRALEEGVRLAQLAEGTVTMLYVLGHPDEDKSVPGSLLQESIDEERRSATAMLEEWKASYEYPVHYKIKVGGIADTILKEMEEADWVVMGTTGLGNRLHRILIGSVTERVLAKATAPVVVVR